MLGLLDELISSFTDTAKDIFGVEEGSITDKAIDIGTELAVDAVLLAGIKELIEALDN